MFLVCGTVDGPLSHWRPLHWGGPASLEPFLFLLALCLPDSAMRSCLRTAPNMSVLPDLDALAAIPAAAPIHASLG